MYRNSADLIQPKKLDVDEKSLTSTYGKFSCEPLERGFGQTIGNALRRILLSSLMGAAITSVRIKSVLHEFSTIPGVTEDVTDIILNLKEIRLK
jgi:DNA-directed RNA polymerase subunit alpha